ncbi:tol-pal system protein YbgF [Propionivibrio limicola]|uniref:tol-pal system protein YbgF n=1 Tax=Propionivibrio limicola TaxID=167645 RepID=UPI001291F8D9|nr:tol-pal system protein YbgF [Propionivibrio limicola]
MTPRRLRLAPVLSTLALLLATLGAQPARAGLFDDEEARRQIRDTSFKVNDRIDALSKGQIDLVNQIVALREENARLHGQVETLTFELESAKKRQQDFYIDLDTRLRKLEPQAPSASSEAKPAEDGGGQAAEASPKPAGDPAAESREYESALNLFKANKIKEAGAAFAAFVKAHPDSTLAPSAQYWLGNAHYSLRDCKKAIDAHRVVVSKWPQHAKAPDALINVATCQQELGDDKGAKTTLNAVVIKYPGSPAAETAKQRLKK